MATVVGGVGYGAYFVAKRYIYPLIAPPTPPQLEQDKASIDASFEKAFALLDQLATDTEELKASEKSRTERLDTALSEVEAVIGAMKDANRRRDDDSRRISDEVRSLRDLIPRAIKTQEETADARLKELGGEMRSLKTLLNNRVGGAQQQQQQQPQQSQPPRSQSSYSFPQPPQTNGATNLETAPASSSSADTAAKTTDEITQSKSTNATPDRSATSSPYSRFSSGRSAAIPAWQMAAAKKSAEGNKAEGGSGSGSGSGSGTTESGTAVDGAGSP